MPNITAAVAVWIKCNNLDWLSAIGIEDEQPDTGCMAAEYWQV